MDAFLQEMAAPPTAPLHDFLQLVEDVHKAEDLVNGQRNGFFHHLEELWQLAEASEQFDLACAEVQAIIGAVVILRDEMPILKPHPRLEGLLHRAAAIRRRHQEVVQQQPRAALPFCAAKKSCCAVCGGARPRRSCALCQQVCAPDAVTQCTTTRVPFRGETLGTAHRLTLDPHRRSCATGGAPLLIAVCVRTRTKSKL